jgi:hypothetical protein
MKYSNAIAIAAATLCGVASSGHATILVNDTWADGERSSTGPDGFGGIDSAWFVGGTGATLTPSVGHLVMGIPTGSGSFTTYFAPEATPVNLANAGDNLTITWVFTTGTIGANNTSQNFRLAVVDTSAAARISTDVPPVNDAFPGYAMFMNMGTTLGNSSPFRLFERNVASGDLLSSSGNWVALGTTGAANGAPGYANNTQYTYTMSLTRNVANGLDIVSTMVGGNLNTSGTASVSFTDTTPNSFIYDTFAIRPSGSASTADSFDTTLFRVDFTSVPEPSALTLVGLGVVAFAGCRRMRR